MENRRPPLPYYMAYQMPEENKNRIEVILWPRSVFHKINLPMRVDQQWRNSILQEVAQEKIREQYYKL